MTEISRWFSRRAVAAVLLCSYPAARADEQLFGFVRGAETLPKQHFEVYQFLTLRTGKQSGDYYGTDFDTEIEYGITDKLQVSASVVQHYFSIENVPDLENKDDYRVGGVELSGKYRLLSPFKDPLGIALRLEGGYLKNDEVAGLPQKEFFIKPEIDFQKDFLDDTLIFDFDFAAEWAWGKQPAEEYPREFSYQAALGAAYRFAPNWFIGAESHVRAEYPLFDLEFFEHRAVFAGPSLHYARQRWWATATWNYQVFGKGVDEPVHGKTYAEETRNVFRLKVGFNF